MCAFMALLMILQKKRPVPSDEAVLEDLLTRCVAAVSLSGLGLPLAPGVPVESALAEILPRWQPLTALAALTNADTNFKPAIAVEAVM